MREKPVEIVLIDEMEERLKELRLEVMNLVKEREELQAELRRVGMVRGSIVWKYVNCGKCKRSCRHGPYAYLVFRDGDKVRTKYLGKNVVESLKAGRELFERMRDVERRMRRINEALNKALNNLLTSS